MARQRTTTLLMALTMAGMLAASSCTSGTPTAGGPDATTPPAGGADPPGGGTPTSDPSGPASTPAASATGPSATQGPEVPGTASAVRAGSVWDVVLVEANDRLNVRAEPGLAGRVLQSLRPDARGLIATGRASTLEGPLWIEVDTQAVRGWISTYYLTRRVGATEFASDDRVITAIDALSDVMAARGDLTDAVSWRGLYVAHYQAPRRFRPETLPTILTDGTARSWGSGACSPDECPRRTFHEAIGARFVSVWEDADVELNYDTPAGGGNAMLPDRAVPDMFSGFHYVAAYDPGDDPAFGGLDWTTWYVFLDYGPDGPEIVGLSLDQWVP